MDSNLDSPESFDLLGLDPRTMQNPYVLYRSLLESEPVYKENTRGVYLVTRYADIMEMKRHPELFSNRSPTGPIRFADIEELPEETRQSIIDSGATSLAELAPTLHHEEVTTLLAADPPNHTRYRALTNKVLNARTVKAWEPRIQQTADELVESLREKETIEWVGDFAHPLPLRAVGAILGVPLDDDAFLDELFGGRDVGDYVGNPVAATQQLIDGSMARNQQTYIEYFTSRISELRKKPKEGEFFSDLIQLVDDDGNRLNDAEILSIVSHFQVAGHETSTKMLTQAMYQLALNPKLWKRVHDERGLISNLCEESLRFEAPVQGLFQIAEADVNVGGVDIPKGSMLMTLYAAANHDPEHFESPDVFNIDRENLRSHLSFGGGIHACMGRSLARAEGLLGFQSVLDGIASVSLTPDANSYERTSSYILRGMRELYIDVDMREK